MTVEHKGQKFLTDDDYCEKDSDCVPDSCCHPQRLINKKFAPDCKEVACTLSCSGPLDCREWKSSCNKNKCAVIFEP